MAALPAVDAGMSTRPDHLGPQVCEALLALRHAILRTAGVGELRILETSLADLLQVVRGQLGEKPLHLAGDETAAVGASVEEQEEAVEGAREHAMGEQDMRSELGKGSGMFRYEERSAERRFPRREETEERGASHEEWGEEGRLKDGVKQEVAHKASEVDAGRTQGHCVKLERPSSEVSDVTKAVKREDVEAPLEIQAVQRQGEDSGHHQADRGQLEGGDGQRQNRCAEELQGEPQKVSAHAFGGEAVVVPQAELKRKRTLERCTGADAVARVPEDPAMAWRSCADIMASTPPKRRRRILRKSPPPIEYWPGECLAALDDDICGP